MRTLSRMGRRAAEWLAARWLQRVRRYGEADYLTTRVDVAVAALHAWGMGISDEPLHALVRRYLAHPLARSRAG